MLEVGSHLRVGGQRGHVRQLRACGTGQHVEVLRVEGDERRQEGLPVPDHHDLAHAGSAEHVLLELHRGDVFPARGDEELFQAAHDLQVPAGVEGALVPGPKPSVGGVERLALVGHASVARAAVAAPELDLVLFAEAHFDAMEGLADGAEGGPQRIRDGGGTAGLGHAVGVQHGDAEAREEALGRRGHGRRTGDGHLEAVEAERGLDLVHDEAPGEAPREGLMRLRPEVRRPPARRSREAPSRGTRTRAWP